MSPHLSVLLPEVIEVISPLEGCCVVDGTFGAGGYTRAFLEKGADVTAFDRDIHVKPHADALSRDYPDRFRWINRRFSEMAEGLSDIGIKSVDAIVLDIGVSSMQLDEAERGFSFMRDGPLDMRMGMEGRTAADIVNEDSAEDIARVLWLYGEERKSRLIAAAIVRRRAEQPFTRTLDLAEVIEKALGGRRGAPTHPATKSFQGLRIAVNDEMGELEQAIDVAEDLLEPGGVLAIVTFQSLEDRLVKSAFNSLTGRVPSASRHLPEVRRETPRFEALTPGGIAPSKTEISVNPRARSARLRAIRKSVQS